MFDVVLDASHDAFVGTRHLESADVHLRVKGVRASISAVIPVIAGIALDRDTSHIAEGTSTDGSTDDDRRSDRRCSPDW